MQHSVSQLVIDGSTRLLTSPAARSLDLTRYSWPLLPYVGPLYESAPIRIVIVGKAPGGWGETRESSLADFAAPTYELWERNAELVRQFIDSVKAHYAGRQGYHSSFWHRTYGICSSLLEGREQVDFTREPERAERTFSSIAWTNVFKIGTRGSNPDRPMADILLDLGPHLSDELELLRPHVVVFSTGHGYDEYLRQSGLTPVRIDSKLATVVGRQAMVGIRCRHFQAQRSVDVDELYRWLMTQRG